MKQFWFFALILALVAGFSFIMSCNKDNDDNDNSGEVNNSIVGTWVVEVESHFFDEGSKVYFASSGDMTVNVADYYSGSYSESGTFLTAGSNITMICDGWKYAGTYSLDGDMLTIKGTVKYLRNDYYDYYYSYYYDSYYDDGNFNVILRRK